MNDIDQIKKTINRILDEKAYEQHEQMPIENDPFKMFDGEPVIPSKNYFINEVPRDLTDSGTWQYKTETITPEQYAFKILKQLKEKSDKIHNRDKMIIIITLCVLAIFIILYGVNTRLNNHDKKINEIEIQIKELKEQQANIIIRDTIYHKIHGDKMPLGANPDKSTGDIMSPVQITDSKPWYEHTKQEPVLPTRKFPRDSKQPPVLKSPYKYNQKVIDGFKKHARTIAYYELNGTGEADLEAVLQIFIKRLNKAHAEFPHADGQKLAEYVASGRYGLPSGWNAKMNPTLLSIQNTVKYHRKRTPEKNVQIDIAIKNVLTGNMQSLAGQAVLEFEASHFAHTKSVPRYYLTDNLKYKRIALDLKNPMYVAWDRNWNTEENI